ncbi:MAG: metallophosphoesterase [Clostridiales bacterium]|nr:metallophosphoesterase [Clostridiales bacterium]
MKVIHCADLHLDSRMNTYLTKEQARERKQELLKTFLRIVSYASDDGARAIIIAGDLFDTGNVSVTTRNTVRDAILEHPEIDFLYLRGNHDTDNFLSKLEEIPANLKLFSSTWTTYRYGNVAITGIEMPKEVPSGIYHSLTLDHDVYNIVVMHGQVVSYSQGSDGEKVYLGSLRNKSIDYLALGHLHEYRSERLDARGIYCYSGCPEGRGFDECGNKGFIRLDINEDTRTARMKFVQAAQRTLHSVPVDVTGVMTSQEAARCIEAELSARLIPQRSLVKIELVGEVTVDSEINCEFLQDMFAEYFYYEKVVDNTHMKVDFSSYEKDISLKGEFIRMVMESEMTEDRKTEVIRCGILALSGEEI